MPATFNIQLVANPNGVQSGVRTAVGELDKMKAKALEVNSAMRAIFGVYAIKELVTSIYELSDGYTALQNKLRVVSTDQNNLNGISERTFDVAQRTRSSWESTATVYSRMARASKGLGVSQSELLSFTEDLNKATIVSGATTMEARNGMIQLSQGMASGKLHGQDLRAVLEDIPYVADVIAKHFKVSRGELREMGKQGKITGRDVIDAFKEAHTTIDEEFGKTLPTITQSLVILHNAAMKFFGEAGTGSGVLAGLAGAVKFVADHFETFGKVLISVLEEIAGFFIIYEVMKLLKALWVVVTGNPLGVLVALLVQGVLLLRQFGDEMETTTKVWTNVDGVFVTVGDHLKALWGVVKELADTIGTALVDAWHALAALFGSDGGIDTQKTEDGFASIIDTVGKWVITLTTLLKHAKDIFLDIFVGVPIILAAKFDEAFSGVLDAIVSVVNKIIAAVNAIMRFGASITKQSVLEKNYEVELSGWRQRNVGEPTAEDRASLMKAAEYDEETADGGRPSSTYQFPQLKVDHDGLQLAADAQRAKIHDDSVQILAENDRAIKKYQEAWHDAAVKRVMDNKKEKGIVSDDPDDPTNKGDAGKVKNNGFDAFVKQLEAMTKRSNEMTAALLQIRDAKVLLDKTLVDKKGVLGTKDKAYTGKEIVENVFGISAGTILDDLETKLRPKTDPFGTWFDEITKKTAAMKGSSEEEARTQEIVKVTQMLEEKGLILKRAERNEIEGLIAVQQHRIAIWNEEKAILATLNGAQQKYFNQLEAFNNLKGGMSSTDRNRVFQDITDAYSKSNDASYEKWRQKMEKVSPFASGWTNSIQKMQDDLLSVSKSVEGVVTQAFTNLQSFVVDSAMNGKVSWDSLISGMEKALDELAFKIIANYIFMKLLTGGSANDASGVPSIDSLKSVYGTDPKTGGVLQGGAHATGGSYIVPGTGAPDSQTVMFRLTPGERVDFTPPGMSGPKPVYDLYVQNPKGAPGSVNHPPPTHKTSTRIINVFDKRELLAAVDTRQGQVTIANTIRSMGGFGRK